MVSRCREKLSLKARLRPCPEPLPTSYLGELSDTAVQSVAVGLDF